MGNIRLFVSHAHADRKIAMALVEVIEAAMVPRERILCTSHPDREKYGEPKGVDVSNYLREHLTQSSCVLGVLTPNSIKSRWCMFELGGAWARATRTYPLLAGGVSRKRLPAALQGAEAVKLTKPKEIRRMLRNVRHALAWDKRVKGSAAKEIDELVRVVRAWKRT